MKPWNPTKLTVSASGVPISRFGDGIMFSAAYVADQGTVEEGADGKARHVDNPSKLADFTIRCKTGSPSNGILMGFAIAGIPIPIVATDGTSVGSFAESMSCKLKKIPDWVRAAEEGVVEWVYNAIDADIVHTGAKE